MTQLNVKQYPLKENKYNHQCHYQDGQEEANNAKSLQQSHKIHYGSDGSKDNQRLKDQF